MGVRKGDSFDKNEGGRLGLSRTFAVCSLTKAEKRQFSNHFFSAYVATRSFKDDPGFMGKRQIKAARSQLFDFIRARNEGRMSIDVALDFLEQVGREADFDPRKFLEDLRDASKVYERRPLDEGERQAVEKYFSYLPYGKKGGAKRVRSPLSPEDVLNSLWETLKETGRRPHVHSGLVVYGALAHKEDWATIGTAFRRGLRGLPEVGAATLTVFAEQRGVPKVWDKEAEKLYEIYCQKDIDKKAALLSPEKG